MILFQYVNVMTIFTTAEVHVQKSQLLGVVHGVMLTLAPHVMMPDLVVMELRTNGHVKHVETGKKSNHKLVRVKYMIMNNKPDQT